MLVEIVCHAGFPEPTGASTKNELKSPATPSKAKSSASSAPSAHCTNIKQGNPRSSFDTTCHHHGLGKTMLRKGFLSAEPIFKSLNTKLDSCIGFGRKGVEDWSILCPYRFEEPITNI